MKKYATFIVAVIIAVSIVLISFRLQPHADGIGDVRYSILKPEVFEKLNPGWKLMAGQPVEQNWQLYQLYNQENLLNDPDYALARNNLPDARGVFVRGMNMSRPTEQGDVDGNRTVGQLQMDVFKSHTHDYVDYYNSDDVESDNSDERAAGITERNSSRTTTPAGGAETRPRNITLYIYIKVN